MQSFKSNLSNVEHKNVKAMFLKIVSIIALIKNTKTEIIVIIV